MPFIISPTAWYLVVADRGHVFICKIAENEKVGITLADAAIVRKWGTAKGLGQLALEGRQDETITDQIGTVFIPAHAIIYIAPAPAWTK